MTQRKPERISLCPLCVLCASAVKTHHGGAENAEKT